MNTREKDLILTKASIIFLTVGTLGIGLSPSIFPMIISMLVQTLGAGFVFVTRSLVTTMIRREQTARLYTVIEILEAVGMIIAGPTIASFFKWGLELGGAWIGLPWVVATGLFIVTATAVWTYKMTPISSEDDVDEI
jgi:MFS family permease